MAKVAKKSASSSKKSVAGTKSPAKKADKQKKAPVKVTPTAKKKVAVKPVAKKAAPASKAVAKKVVAKKVAKPAPVPAKKVATKKSAVPSKPIAKAVASKKAGKPEVKAKTKAAPVSKKTVAVSKPKPAPVAKVEKTAKAKPVATVKASAKENAPKKDDKKAVVAVASTDVAAVAALKTAPATKPRRKKKKNDDDDDDEEEVVFRKPAKAAKTSAVKKTSAKYVSEELTLEGPAPRRIGVMTMTSDEKIKLKKALLNKCIDIQKNTVAIAKKAMEDALNSANAEKVTEELSDSFRESMHATRDMYARQANEGVNNLGLLNRINIVEHEKVKFGSVVFTNFQNYFISTGLGEIKVDDVSFQAVSTLAPLFQILVDKKKGDTFMFLDRLYTVIEIF